MTSTIDVWTSKIYHLPVRAHTGKNHVSHIILQECMVDIEQVYTNVYIKFGVNCTWLTDQVKNNEYSKIK